MYKLNYFFLGGDPPIKIAAERERNKLRSRQNTKNKGLFLSTSIYIYVYTSLLHHIIEKRKRRGGQSREVQVLSALSFLPPDGQPLDFRG